jgi:hypothetical protein
MTAIENEISILCLVNKSTIKINVILKKIFLNNLLKNGFKLVLMYGTYNKNNIVKKLRTNLFLKNLSKIFSKFIILIYTRLLLFIIIIYYYLFFYYFYIHTY